MGLQCWRLSLSIERERPVSLSLLVFVSIVSLQCWDSDEDYWVDFNNVLSNWLCGVQLVQINA